MLKQTLLASVTLILTSIPFSPAVAQIAEIPQPDASGNFPSARVLGNRGEYLQRKWLVVDPDEKGLNCRDRNGKVLLRVSYGAAVDSVIIQTNKLPQPRTSIKPDWDAIQSLSGQPWIYVRVNQDDIRQRLVERRDFYLCYVRANSKFIAPINEDQL